MKKSSVILICLLVMTVIFSYTVAVTAFEPSIQQNDNVRLGEKTTLNNSPKLTPRKRLGTIILGDPIDNPKPHKH